MKSPQPLCWLWSRLETPLLRVFFLVLIVFGLALALTWALVMGVLFPLALDFGDSVSLASTVFTCMATLALAVGFFLTSYVEESRRLVEGTTSMLTILNTFTTSEMYNSHSPCRGSHQVHG
jgi:predicted MFS family arabinose efflux permease